jgi:hypothetical protein
METEIAARKVLAQSVFGDRLDVVNLTKTYFY